MRRVGPEGTLIQLSAATAERRDARREEGAELGRRADWDLLQAILSRRRLLPQLGPRIVEISQGCASASFASAVERSTAQTRRQSALLLLVTGRLIRALAEGGISSMTLKGASLAEAIYGDPGSRASSDIDLLVAASDLPAAVEILRQAGYGPPSGYVGDDGLPLLHLLLNHERSELPPVELHWRIHWYENHFAYDMLTRGETDRRGCLRPALADDFASLLLFYARDGFQDLRLATDLGAWWDKFGLRLQPSALRQTVVGYPALAKALLAALRVAEEVVGVPAASLVGSSRRLDVRARLATCLADPHPDLSFAQLNADMGLVDWLLTPHGGQRDFVVRQLLPPRDVLEERSRKRGERRASAAGHGVRVLARYGIALARISGPSPARLDHRFARRTRANPFRNRHSTYLSPL